MVSRVPRALQEMLATLAVLVPVDPTATKAKRALPATRAHLGSLVLKAGVAQRVMAEWVVPPV
jgi:hypothetical protein